MGGRKEKGKGREGRDGGIEKKNRKKERERGERKRGEVREEKEREGKGERPRGRRAVLLKCECAKRTHGLELFHMLL